MRSSLLTGIAILLLASASTATETPHTLEELEVRTLIIGKTIEIDRGDRSSVRVRLDADGRGWVHHKNAIGTVLTDSITWSFDQRNRLCLDWRKSSGWPQGCFSFVRTGRALHMEKRNKEFSHAVKVE